MSKKGEKREYFYYAVISLIKKKKLVRSQLQDTDEAGDQISTTTTLFTPFKFYMEW